MHYTRGIGSVNLFRYFSQNNASDYDAAAMHFVIIITSNNRPGMEAYKNMGSENLASTAVAYR
jgi:hypothetical protein